MYLPRLRPALALAVLSLAFAAPASASDSSIERAWDADDKQFTELGKSSRTAFLKWQDSGFERSGPVLRVNRRTRALLRKNRAAVAAEQPSTDTGATAKGLALLSDDQFATQLRREARGVRLTTAGKRQAGNRAFAAAERALKRSAESAKAARSLFRQAA